MDSPVFGQVRGEGRKSPIGGENRAEEQKNGFNKNNEIAK